MGLDVGREQYRCCNHVLFFAIHHSCGLESGGNGEVASRRHVALWSQVWKEMVEEISLIDETTDKLSGWFKNDVFFAYFLKR